MSKTPEKMRLDLGDAQDLVSEAYDRAMLAYMAVRHLLEHDANEAGTHELDRDQSNALIFAVGSVMEAVRDARHHLDQAMR